MSWLKKIGQGMLTGTQIVLGAKLPFALPAPTDKTATVIQEVNDTLGAVGGIVVQAEAFGAALDLSGDEKLKGAMGAAAQIVLQSSLMAGEAPHDPALFMDGVKDLTGGIAKILNSRKG